MASSYFVRMNQQGRMDRAYGGQASAQAQGFGTGEAGCGVQDTGFKAAYAEVVKCNEQAYTVTESSTATGTTDGAKKHGHESEAILWELLTPQIPQGPELALQSAPQPEGELFDQANPLLETVDPLKVLLETRQSLPIPSPSLPIEGVMVPENALRGAEASALIRMALTEIGDALQLSIDPGIQELIISGNASGLTQQFAEILATLKQIAGVLEEAATKGQTIDLGKAGVIDVPQARELASFIQVRTFRIEIAVSMLGIGEAVQNELAATIKGVSSGGIIQAVDPTTLSMPQTHVDRLFGRLFADTTQSIGALVAKVRELAAENGQSPDTVIGLKVAVATTTSRTTVQASGMPLPSAFDALTLRKLLKVDGVNECAVQNTEAAAQAAKVSLSAGGLKMVVGSALQEAMQTANELLPVGDAAGKLSLGHSVELSATKAALPLFRGAEESVLRQITERLQSVIRSGLSEIRLQLRPESLGEVKMRIRVEGDVVFARIQVESQQVKQIVETNLQSLKESLLQQHLSCGSLEVGVGNDSWEKEGPALRNGTTRGMAAPSGAIEHEHDTPAVVTLGSETGRRFGNNTIEYFA